MGTPEQLAKNAMNGAGSAAGQVFTAKVLETLLGDAKISKPAQDAILSMQQHFFPDNTHPDFITPLRRTGIFMGKDPFKKAETFAYLGGKIEANHRRLSVLTNMNLKEAATLLWDLHCQIALHIMHRRNDNFERSDADHSYVLMYMQESVSVAFELICNKPALTDEDVTQLKIKIMAGIVEAFHSYIQNTQSEQSSGARRTAIDHNVRETMEKVAATLDRFTTEKPLRTSIESLQQTAQAFYHVLKQMLLAVVLVPRKEAEKQQVPAWVLQRKMVLAKTAQSDYEGMLTHLSEERSVTTGYQGKSGVLYTNPFAERVHQLSSGSTLTQDRLYFRYIMQVFASSAKPRDEQTEQEFAHASEQFNSLYIKLIDSDSFLLKDMLHDGASEVEFVTTAVLLYRQSHELAHFMAALQHFMQLVGKLGLYNNPALHTQLTSLIQAVSTGLEHNLTRMHGFARQGSEAAVGGWLNPIDEMLQQLKRQGNSITRELQSFQGHFAKIIDPVAMQMEFNKSKIELLQAALGLGHASQIESTQMDAIARQIGVTAFAHFVEPIARTNDGVDASARMTEILALAQEMGQRLDTAETDVTAIRAQHEATCAELERVRSEMLLHEHAFKGDGARLQSKAVELSEHIQRAEAKLVELDRVVESFGQRVKQQLSELNADSAKDVEEANRLMEAARANLASSSSQALSDQMTLLSRLKGRLEERQKSYQKLVESVTVFQAEYTVKRGTVSLALTSVQEVARDIDRTVLELVAKIGALTDIISSLRQTLDEKDKQLAGQQARLLELEAQLSALRSRRGSTLSGQAYHAEETRADNELLHNSIGRMSRPSAISFMPGPNRNPPLSQEYRIQRAIEIYETDITHGQFVRNKARKVVKYAIWCELNRVVFQGEALHGEPADVKGLIMAVIEQVKVGNYSIKGKKDTYVFNDIVSGQSNEDIYLEFLKGKSTQSAIKDLDRSFRQYLEQRGRNFSMEQFSSDRLLKSSGRSSNRSEEVHAEAHPPHTVV